MPEVGTSERKQVEIQFNRLLNIWKPQSQKKDIVFVERAFELAFDAHKGMKRKSGVPYILHPIHVARILVNEMGVYDQVSIACALLHDVVEDTHYTQEDIRIQFGDEVAKIVAGLTKISKIFKSTKQSLQAENFRKMLLTLSDDVRVILIKMADRLHNMRTLEHMKREKQLKISSETLFFYAPLAHRLGLNIIKSEMEELALKYTEPDVYHDTEQKLIDTKEKRERMISGFIKPLKEELEKRKLKFKIYGRTKSIYSIWQKMKTNKIPFEEVFDVFAIRIIIDPATENEGEDCWKAYTVVTKLYNPNQKRLRDWISTPKANGYEALHTTVMGLSGKWVEVQIRSSRMDEIAERGYAAHWKYKKDELAEETALDRWLNRINKLLKQSQDDAVEFVNEFKLNLFTDEIFVYTPKGELRTLPAKSTVLDFAYGVHTEIGNRCLGAKVNHVLVPRSYILRSGDQIEILTSSTPQVNAEWLDTAITARAHSKIKTALKEKRKNRIGLGKTKIKVLFDSFKIEYNEKLLKQCAHFFGLSKTDDLFYKISLDRITGADIKSFQKEMGGGGFFQKLAKPFSKSKTNKNSLTSQIQDKLNQQPESLVLDDIENLRYKTVICCNSIPGDDVMGCIRDDQTIEIHKTNCDVAIEFMSKYGSRIVKAKWKNDESIRFLTGLQLTGIDRIGVMNKIIGVISDIYDINMRNIFFESHDGFFKGSIMLYINDTNTLKKLVSQLNKIKEVKKISRIDRMED